MKIKLQYSFGRAYLGSYANDNVVSGFDYVTLPLRNLEVIDDPAPPLWYLLYSRTIILLVSEKDKRSVTRYT